MMLNQSRVHNNIYQRKSVGIDNKKFELIRALSLKEDDEGNLWNVSSLYDLTEEEKEQLLTTESEQNVRKRQEKIRKDRQTRWINAKQKIESGFQNLDSSISGIEIEVIEDTIRELKRLCDEGIPEEKKAFVEEVNRPENTDWEDRARNRIDVLNRAIDEGEKIKIAIEEATDSADLEDERSLHKRIKKLEENNSAPNHKIIELNHIRQSWQNPLKDYESLIKEIKEADTWKNLKEACQKVSYTSDLSADKYKFLKRLELLDNNNPFSLLKIVQKNVQQVLNTYNSKDFRVLIEQEVEKVIQTIENCNESIDGEVNNQINDLEDDLKRYNLNLPAGKEIKDLKSLLSKQKEKLEFRREFRDQIRDVESSIENEVIDSYFNKGISAKLSADVYSLDSNQRILAEEIANKKAYFAGQIYDLQKEEELKTAQKDKKFISDFRGQGIIPDDFTNTDILTYYKTIPNITAKEAFSALRQGWDNPNQIQIDNNGRKQINLGDGWKDYDWEQESFDKANYRYVFLQTGNNLETERDLPSESEIDSWQTKYHDARNACLAYNNFWETDDLGDFNNFENRGKITWDKVTYEITINPLLVNKKDAYFTSFFVAPRSLITGADISRILSAEAWREEISAWMKKHYPPKKARIAHDNGQDANGVPDWNTLGNNDLFRELNFRFKVFKK